MLFGKEGWKGFMIIKDFATHAQAKTYAINELPTGWAFGILQYKNTVEFKAGV